MPLQICKKLRSSLIFWQVLCSWVKNPNLYDCLWPQNWPGELEFFVGKISFSIVPLIVKIVPKTNGPTVLAQITPTRPVRGKSFNQELNFYPILKFVIHFRRRFIDLRRELSRTKSWSTWQSFKFLSSQTQHQNIKFRWLRFAENLEQADSEFVPSPSLVKVKLRSIKLSWVKFLGQDLHFYRWVGGW